MSVIHASRSNGLGLRSSQGGFTILELMLASSVFAVILLIVASGVISFTNTYYKGVTATKTQAAARSIMDTISQGIQFGQSVQIPAYYASGTTYNMCIDDTLYSFRPGQEVIDTPPFGADQGYHGLVAMNGCNMSATLPATANLANGRELLGEHMRVNILNVMQNGNLYTIHLRLISGEDDLLVQPVPSNIPAWESSSETCAGNQAGTQFCAVADLTTTVEKRIL
jgi:prepilin-type N-terminal cleavage/methylation domain-containing protein